MTFDLMNPGQLMQALGPDLILMAGAMVAMLVAAWKAESDAHQRTVGYLSLGVIGASLVTVLVYASAGAKASAGVIAVDGFRWAADVVFLLGAALTILLSIESNPRDRIVAPESHVLVLFATSGMMIMAAARDLMIVFLGVEMMSIAVYVLAGLNRGSVRSAEGALKYFLLGAFSTGFLLYGIALVYGATGSTDIVVIGQRIVQYSLTGHSMLLIGVGLLLVGFAFKVAAVPFHMWAPDVYEGAPTPITAYMAAAVKAAAFTMILRVWIEAFNLNGALVARAGLSDTITTASAATHGYHIGEPPDPRTIAHARKRGYDLSTQRARRLDAGDFERFDRILACDRGQHAIMTRLAPRGSRAQLGMLLDCAPELGLAEVPDPYYGGPADFEHVLDLVEHAAGRLLAALS